MNTIQSDARTEVISNALSAATSRLIPAGPARWQFTVDNGAPHLVTAKTYGDWLILEAHCHDAAQYGEYFWDRLGRNASLSGLAKIVMSADGHLGLRAELPVVEGADLAVRIREVCDGFESVWFPVEYNPAIDSAASELGELPDLKNLCTESGWPFIERGGSKLAVELEVPEGFYQARLVPQHRGVRVSCDLSAIEAVSEESRRAVAGLLLTASGLVRMVRSTVRLEPTPPVAQFEVVFGTPPSPAELSSALECLSVGCSLCGEEIKTLQAPAIAERYLALRGWGADAPARRNERTVTTT